MAEILFVTTKSCRFSLLKLRRARDLWLHLGFVISLQGAVSKSPPNILLLTKNIVVKLHNYKRLARIFKFLVKVIGFFKYLQGRGALGYNVGSLPQGPRRFLLAFGSDHLGKER